MPYGTITVLSAAGDKSDKIDRKVLAMFPATFHQDNKPLSPDDPEIISLRIACQDRLRLVEERTAKLNELPEANWIRSLPGAGDVLAPSLLACLGRDQQRFDSAAAVGNLPRKNSFIVAAVSGLRSIILPLLLILYP